MLFLLGFDFAFASASSIAALREARTEGERSPSIIPPVALAVLDEESEGSMRNFDPPTPTSSCGCAW